MCYGRSPTRSTGMKDIEYLGQPTTCLPRANELRHVCEGGECGAPEFWEDHCHAYPMVLAMLDGDRDALAWVATYYHPLTGIAVAKTKGRVKLSEVYEAFMILLPKYNVDKRVPFKAFLNSLLAFRALDIARRDYSRADLAVSRKVEAWSRRPEHQGKSSRVIEDLLVADGEVSSQGIKSYRTRYNLAHWDEYPETDITGEDYSLSDSAESVVTAEEHSDTLRDYAQSLLAFVPEEEHEYLLAYTSKTTRALAEERGMAQQHVTARGRKALQRLRLVLNEELNRSNGFINTKGLQCGLDEVTEAIHSGRLTLPESK